MAATKALAGIVKIQAQTMFPATPQRCTLAHTSVQRWCAERSLQFQIRVKKMTFYDFVGFNRDSFESSKQVDLSFKAKKNRTTQSCTVF